MVPDRLLSGSELRSPEARRRSVIAPLVCAESEERDDDRAERETEDQANDECHFIVL
jgi:hypothetical protein